MISANSWSGATRALGRAFVTLTACSALSGALSVNAQSIALTQTPPSPYSGTSAPISIAFSGSYGEEAFCGPNGAPPGPGGQPGVCPTETFYSMPDLASLRVLVDGVVQTNANLTITTEAEACTYNDDGTYQCVQPYSATGTVSFASGQDVELGARVTFGDLGTVEAPRYTFRTLTGGPPGAPLVALNNLNAGTTIERDLCLTISVGTDAAAYECGDLRLVHALPSTKTFNKIRTPTLVYNSQHAHPYPLIAADVTVPSGIREPQTVEGIVRINGVVRGGVQRWNGADWVSGAVRRVVLGFDALDLQTGVYGYTLEMTNVYADGTRHPAAVSTGQVAIVNRALAPDNSFGNGWWLAGLEQLRRFAPDSMLWVGGDGSTRVYLRSAADTMVWRAPALDRLDSIRVSSNGYTRHLPHRLRVDFDALGRHTSTTNRLGQNTAFEYQGTSKTLTAVIVPPYEAVKSYLFSYDGSGKLEAVTAPMLFTGTRVTGVTVVGGAVTQITDADGKTVQFQMQDVRANVVTSRTDRRGTRTKFELDAGQRLSRVEVLMEAAPSLVTTFAAAETKGIGDVSAIAMALLPDSAYTKHDGPRDNFADANDVTKFWVDLRWGAPVRVVNALGDVTSLERLDASWPALVTKLIRPNGFVSEASYFPTTGLLHQSIDRDPRGTGTGDAVTTYTWDPTWEFTRSITSPEGRISEAEYDPANGNRIWQQAGGLAANRVTFQYHASGLLRSTTLPGTRADSVGYDALGNVSATRTPLGYLTQFENDWVGQPWAITRHVTDTMFDGRVRSYDLVQKTYYDVMGRDTLSVSTAPGDNMYFEWRDQSGYLVGLDDIRWKPPTLNVHKLYDEEGNTVAVTRDGYFADYNQPQVVFERPNSALVTRWVYDRMNRAVRETAPDLERDSSVFDAAGNVIRSITRRGHVITMTYDALGRVKSRSTPAVAYPANGETYVQDVFPHYVSRATNQRLFTSITTPSDQATFTYHATGGVQTAFNRDARVTRDYFPNGALKSEEQRVGTYDENRSDRYTRHVYRLDYAYNRDGQRSSLGHPAALLLSSSTTQTGYRYNALGQLDSIITPYNERYGFEYDDVLRLRRVHFPNGVSERSEYDDDQRRTRQLVDGAACYVEGCAATVGSATDDGFPGGVIHDNRFVYDTRGKLVDATDRLEWHRMQYAPAGELVRSQDGYLVQSQNAYWRRVSSTSISTVDAFSNQMWSSRRGSNWQQPVAEDTFALEPVTGRLRTSQALNTQAQSFFTVAPNVYDASGNLHLTQIWRPTTRCTMTSPNCEEGIVESFAEEKSANYYGADQKLRVNDRMSTDLKLPGGVEEYRYDALGRRVLRRFRRECRKPTYDYAYCEYLGETVRYVWDGAEILYEIRGYGKDTAQAASIEQDLVPYVNNPIAAALSFGVVLYTHGTVLDRPLAATRTDLAGWDNFAGTLFLHTNWSGKFDMGTLSTGRRDKSRVMWRLRRMSSKYASTTFDYADEEEGVWYGSLLDVQTDGSRNVYMRNRYYDPASGRFTQEDPIGLAGGMNAYGFANGDPVNFSDPFGLCPKCKAHNEQMVKNLTPETQVAARRFLEAVEDAGMDVMITSGFRSNKEQDALYAQGRTTPGPIVTNAKGGQSNHNSGRAIDVVEADKKGRLLWGTSNWEKIGELGKASGFEWGGDWKKIDDKPHLETPKPATPD